MKRMLFAVSLIALSTLICAAQDAPPATQEDRPRGGQGQRMERGRGVGGTITAIDGQALKLKSMNGKEITVKITDQTKFSKDRQEAKLSDFKVGDAIAVRGEASGENTWTAQMVMTAGGAGGMMQMMQEGMGKQFIAGEVKKIDELKLTILRIDGQTQVIEVDETTSFRKQGESITLADIKAGDQVMGRGQLKSGTFVPVTLNVGNLPMMRMGGNPPEKKPEPK